MSSDFWFGFLIGSIAGGVSVWQALFQVRKETKQKKDHIKRLSDKIEADLKKLYTNNYLKSEQ